MFLKIGAHHYAIIILWVVLLERQVECAEGPRDSSDTESDNREGEGVITTSITARRDEVLQRTEEPDREEEIVKTLLKEGQMANQQNDYQTAISKFTMAIEKRPLVPKYYAYRAGSYWKNENLNEAERDLRKAIELTPLSRQLIYSRQLVTILLQSKQYEEAIKEITRVDDDVNLMRMGDQFADGMKFDLAYKCYDEAIKKNPNEVAYVRKRANCSSRRGNFGLAVADYRMILKKMPGSLVDRKALVNVLFDAKEFEEAVRETFRTDASKFEDLAKKFRSVGKVNEAILCYTEAIKRAPENKSIYLKRGKVYLAEQKLDKAIIDFKTVLASHTDLTYARKLLVKALLESQSIEQAIKEMVLLNDNELYFLAYEMFLAGKSEKALHCCTEAIKKASHKEKYFKLRGNCHKRLGNYKSAIEDFRAAIQVSKESPPPSDFMIEFSQLLIEDGNYVEAEKILKSISQENLTEDEAVNLLNLFERIKEMEKTKAAKLLRIGSGGEDSELLIQTPFVSFDVTTARPDDANREEGRTVVESLDTARRELALFGNPGQSSSQPSTSETALGKRKERHEAHSQELQLTLKDLLGVSSSREEPHGGQSDKYDMLAKIWTQDLKNVTDPQQMLFAKKAIGDVLFEAQLGTLRRNSVIIEPKSTHQKTSDDMESDHNEKRNE